ncbi:MAG: hypothetical protein IPM70_18915 [Proteobacteria bacterium]|nr:hypothetical protein [Pseudomonadota bacterium]
MTAVVLPFWLTLFAIAYPYAIYPTLLLLVNRIFKQSMPTGNVSHEPTLTILMPVHNEAGRVARKVENLLSLDYPPGKIQIVAIADGCSDDSVARLRESGATDSR